MDFLSQCTSGGCGAKIESRVLNQLLQHLPETPANERLLVGFEHADDAAVYQITPEKALISTVDFFHQWSMIRYHLEKLRSLML
ncbi:hypothetical protein UO7_01858 [Enterococcus faecalis EnGen0290]|jgi:selenide,water dikinase|nr:hypothetical protein UO7_01858 [Enterococcus faecalis EnGen0290]